MVELTAIILSGGFSNRMGADKGLVMFRGKPMIERSLELAKNVTDSIMIIANNGGYEHLGYPVYPDILKEKGPIGGIHAGLSKSTTLHNLVLACDMPLLTQVFIQYLITETNTEDNIVVPRHGEQIEPLCAIYHKDCLPLIEKAANSPDLSMHNFIDQNATKFLDINEQMAYYSPYLFSNANNLEELKKLEIIKR